MTALEQHTEEVVALTGGEPSEDEATAGAERRVIRRILKDPFARIGLVLVVLLIAFVFLTPFLTDPNDVRIDGTRRLLGPFEGGDAPLLGTDHQGRSLLITTSRGLRTSFVIGCCAVALSAAIGWIFGVVTGFVGGKLDDFGGRVMDLFNAFPGLLLVIALVTALGPSIPNIIFVLAIVTWVVFGRVARAQALSLSASPFIDAARVSGVGLPRMMGTHVRLNTVSLIGALMVIELPRLILGEAALSFLGFGIEAPNFSLGSVIAEERDYLQVSAWAVTFPGMVLATLCVGTAFLGVGIRTALASTGSEDEL